MLLRQIVILFSSPARQSSPPAAQGDVSRAAARPSAASPDRFVEVVAGGQAERYQPSVTVRVSYETSGMRFLRDAKQYHSREGKLVEAVPFMQYWPTYSAMTREQQNWYFYWRSQVRHNNFLQADLSYIFIHIYELLNLVEQTDPVSAAERIWVLWQHYRVEYPTLDNYLPDWGGDLLAVHKDIATGLTWWQQALQLAQRISDPLLNFIIQHYVESNHSAEMPYSIWVVLTNYRPRNKFYQEHNRDGVIDRAYERAIRVTDNYWRRTSGQSVLEKFTSKRLHSIRKPIFASALIGYEHPESITLGQSRTYLGETRLNEHLTSVVKYTENLLRKQMKFTRKLSGIELDNGLANALNDAFMPEVKGPEPIRVTLDPARVAVLRLESELIGTLLGETEAENSSDAFAKPLYTDLAEMRQLWTDSDVPDRYVIADVFQRKTHHIAQLDERLSHYALLPNMVIDRINERALHLLGDRLIYVAGDGSLTLAEDFTDEIEVVLQESPLAPGQTESASSPQFSPVFSDNAWDSLLARLTPVEMALVSLFATNGNLSEAEIESATRPFNVMANAALDGLNEKASEHLGHPPLYSETNSWFVEDDDLLALRQRLSPPGAS